MAGSYRSGVLDFCSWTLLTGCSVFFLLKISFPLSVKVSEFEFEVILELLNSNDLIFLAISALFLAKSPNVDYDTLPLFSVVSLEIVSDSSFFS